MGAFVIGVGNNAAMISSNTVINGGAGGSLGFGIRSYEPSYDYVDNAILTRTSDYGWAMY